MSISHLCTVWLSASRLDPSFPLSTIFLASWISLPSDGLHLSEFYPFAVAVMCLADVLGCSKLS